jgi:hypothetical protein
MTMTRRIWQWFDLALGTALAIALAAVLATLWPPEAAQAATAEERRTVGPFDAIASSGNWDLVVHAGATTAVSIAAEPAIAARIDTVVEGSTLQIRPRRGESPHVRGDARVDITLPTLRALQLTGAGDARVEAMKTPRLAITLSGAGDIRLDGLDTDDLELRIAGSGDARAAGTARRLAVSINGSGDVAADTLAADDVTIRIAGSGNASVSAAKTLDAAIAGSGSVEYRGAPVVQRRIAGSGTVTAR